MTTAAKLRLVAVVIAVIVAVILVLQNTETVTTRIFFISIDMPRVVLLLLMLAIGFVLGSLFGGSLRKRKPQ